MHLPDYQCVLCHCNMDEDLAHLLFDCPFAAACWNWLQIQIEQQMDFLQNLDGFRRLLQVPFFTEIIIIM